MILLITRYEAGKEAMRVMAQKNSRDRRILGLSRRCSRIKNQLTEYLKIELGNIKILFTELFLIKQFCYLGLEVFFQMLLTLKLLLLDFLPRLLRLETFSDQQFPEFCMTSWVSPTTL